MNNKKYIIIVVSVLVLFLVGGIFLITRKKTTPLQKSIQTIPTPAEQAIIKVEKEKKTDEILTTLNSALDKTRLTDKDLDGITDVEEKKLGTDPNHPDTDGDGLLDGDEIKIYHTNPLNADTDGDSFKDGYEVRRGYNPNGPGKLVK